MNNYVTIDKTIEALSLTPANVQELFTSIGAWLVANSAPSELRADIYKINTVIARTKANDYVCIIDNKWVSMTKARFESIYELVT